ncbi:ATP-binding protein [Phenylobacterium sp. J367]|uniref:ATP-binding protein n=1 Tax=Phenylobacterium sp. J367 TaxID=2898435 RepID=UPI0021513704|nr:ATP-binding protein [Phenylobacterium sp. J367]MCR5879123.1 ATP-binding protein [Phenylobacterium sp. J367]
MRAGRDFALIARARAQARFTRLGAAAVMVALSMVLAPSIWPLLWFAAVALAQIPDALAFGPFLKSEAPPTPRQRLHCAGATLLSTGVYSAIAPYLWVQGGPAGQAVIVILVAASLLHVGVHMHHDRTILAVGIAPFLLQWFALPWLTASQLGPVGVACVQIAGVVFVAHIWVAIRNGWMNAEALMDARDEADAANHAKSRFLATMTHEIRTPLNGVLGMAQAMAADPLPKTQAARLAVIRQSGAALLAILNDVLDLSKIEAGKLEIETVAFDAAEVVTGAVQAYSSAADAKGLRLVLEIEPGAEGRFLGDPARIRQIAYNLISNAVKFTEEGAVHVTLARAGDRSELRVDDTGPGLSEQQLAGLFRPFAQAKASDFRRHGGTGLGLAICKELAGLMGGEMRVESAPGEGSTFILAVPLAPAPKGEAAEPARSPAAAMDRKLRVLAAEDNAVNRLVLQTLLQQGGIEPTLVEDGTAALAAWRGQDWDIVLLDSQMPGMDGTEVARAIRAEEATTGRARTPILALTANVMTHHLAEYRDAGMDDCVAKPLEVQRLYEAMATALEAPADAPKRKARGAA